MEHIIRTLAVVAVLTILWSTCESDDTKKKRILISYLCCRNHNLLCKNRREDENELILCLHRELEMAQYAGNKSFCKEFHTLCGPGANVQPVSPREASGVSLTSETNCAKQEPLIINRDHDCEDPTYVVSIQAVVLIAILMFLLGIGGMLIFTCFTYELWPRWKICKPFHSCLSHDVENIPNKSKTGVPVVSTNRNMNNPTYQDPDMANHSMEPCVYDTPRDSIDAEHVCNPLYSVGTHESTNKVTEETDGNKDSSYINMSQYELLNESESQSEREHKYSCIQLSETNNLDAAKVTSESASAGTHETEYQKVKGNHEYLEVEAHSKATAS